MYRESSADLATPFYYIATFCLESAVRQVTAMLGKGVSEVMLFRSAPGNTPATHAHCFCAVRPPTLSWSCAREPTALGAVTSAAKQSSNPLVTPF